MPDDPRKTSPFAAPSAPNPQLKAAILSASYKFAGPLPPPQILDQYEKLHPGITQKLFDAVQAEGLHRQSMESKALDANIEAMRRGYREARWGQILAFLIAVAFLVGGIYLSTHGQPWPGAVLGVGGIGGIVTTFIIGRGAKPVSENGENQAGTSAPSNPKT
jgi:uncharacterized membrane protein